jgi:hypothetical protein
MLRTVENNGVDILARSDLKTQRNVIAISDLAHQPADTVRFVSRGCSWQAMARPVPTSDPGSAMVLARERCSASL